MNIYYGRDQKIHNRISPFFQENESFIATVLEDCDDIVKNKFFTQNKTNKVAIFYVDGIADSELTEDFVIRPLTKHVIPPMIIEDALLNYIGKQILETIDWKIVTTYEEMITGILSGDTLLLIEGSCHGILLSTKSFPTRGVGETTQEMVIRGPKDSFTESFRTNTALIRRRIRDPRLKMEQIQVGERSKTDIAITYMKDLVQPKLLAKVKENLSQLSYDGIFDNGMLEQLLEEHHFSPFPQIQHTERPDKAASGLLEGRIVLVVDNSPGILLIPATYSVFFQTGDDYYNRFIIASFSRILRFISALLALLFPALYVATVGFHTEILPTQFLLAITRARTGIAIPVVAEVLLMEFQFELLKEASIHLPGQLGGTIGIVGGLIVGQAAVDAGLVSTIVVIVVAFTAIASFSVPNESFASVFRLLKFVFILIAAVWGMYGLILAFCVLLAHLSRLESFGIPYLYPQVSILPSDDMIERYPFTQPDHYLRFPYRYLSFRPIFTKAGRKIRMKKEKS